MVVAGSLLSYARILSRSVSTQPREGGRSAVLRDRSDREDGSIDAITDVTHADAPAEKMLAAVDPGYPYLAVTSLLDTHLNNGSLQFVGYTADTPAGVVYGEALNNAFYDAPPVKEFRKKFPLAKFGGIKAFAAIAAEGVSRVRRQKDSQYRHSRVQASLSFRREGRVCSVDGELPAARGYRTEVDIA